MTYADQLRGYKANIARQLLALMRRPLKDVHETGYEVWLINCLLIETFERIDRELGLPLPVQESGRE